MKKRVYITGDATASCQDTRSILEKEGFDVECFENSNLLFETLQLKECDLVIFNVTVPTSYDFVVCAKIRQLYSVPIIMLVEKMTDDEYAFGISLGIDACLIKPINSIRIIAHIRALLIKSELSQVISFKPAPQDELKQDSLTYGDIEINLDKLYASCNGKHMKLTMTELSMLTIMVQNPAKAMTRKELFRKIWGNASEINIRATDDAVKRLRKKLIAAKSSVSLETIRGYGFRLILDDEYSEKASVYAIGLMSPY